VRLASGFFILAVVAACRERPKDVAPCGAVAMRQLSLAQAALGSATVDPETRRLVAAQLPAMRDALIQTCTEGAWSPAVRNCMVQAPDHAAFQACEQRLTDDQRRALDRAARGETPSP
jgi:hypothetical protein